MKPPETPQEAVDRTTKFIEKLLANHGKAAQLLRHDVNIEVRVLQLMADREDDLDDVMAACRKTMQWVKDSTRPSWEHRGHYQAGDNDAPEKCSDAGCKSTWFRPMATHWLCGRCGSKCEAKSRQGELMG